MAPEITSDIFGIDELKLKRTIEVKNDKTGKLEVIDNPSFHANLRYAGTIEGGNETLAAQMAINRKAEDMMQSMPNISEVISGAMSFIS